MTYKKNPEAICSNCPYWAQITTKASWKEGECHRYPPNLILISSGNSVPVSSVSIEGFTYPVSRYPMTRETGLCGEHPEFLIKIEPVKDKLEVEVI